MYSDNEIAVIEAAGYVIVDILPNGAVRTDKGTLTASEVEDLLED